MGGSPAEKRIQPQSQGREATRFMLPAPAEALLPRKEEKNRLVRIYVTTAMAPIRATWPCRAWARHHPRALWSKDSLDLGLASNSEDAAPLIELSRHLSTVSLLSQNSLKNDILMGLNAGLREMDEKTRESWAAFLGSNE